MLEYNIIMGVLNGFSVYNASFSDVIKIDNDLIPTQLIQHINDPKKLTLELFQPVNIGLRNSIISFTQKTKTAMNFRSQNKQGSRGKVPWPCSISNNVLSFNQMADQFYFLASPLSKFNLVLTIAVNINRSLKLQMQYADNNRFYCPKYLLKDANGKVIPFFSQIITGPNHRQQLVSKNNVVRMLLGGSIGFQNSGYTVEIDPTCKWWNILPTPHDAV